MAGVILAGLMLVASALAGAVPTRAQAASVERTATLLADLAQHVDRRQPDRAFTSGGLRLEADATETYLRFFLGKLPRGAAIKSWTLRMDVANPGSAPQAIRVYALDPGPHRFDSDTGLTWQKRPTTTKIFVEARVPARRGTVDLPLPSPAREPPQGSLAVMLRAVRSGPPSSSSQEYTFHGLCGRPSTSWCNETNRQPRLIVRYELPAAAGSAGWLQPGYDAQQSYRTAWEPSVDVTEVASRVVYSGKIAGAPAVLGDRLIFATQRDDVDVADLRFFMTAVDLGGHQVWEMGLSAVVKYPPVVDHSGQIGVVTEDAFHQMMTMGRNQPGDVVYPWTFLEPGSSLSAREPPTVGANDALYFSTDRGVFAVAPDVTGLDRVWWRLGSHGARFGRVALSPDEQVAYVVAFDGAGKPGDVRCASAAGGPAPSSGPGRLVAIDNVSGRELWRAGAFTEPSVGAALPVPVVTSAAVVTGDKRARRTLVYVVDGHERGRSLQVFDGRAALDGGRPEPRCTVTTTTGIFTRPVVSGDGAVTLVRSTQGLTGRLCRYGLTPSLTAGEMRLEEQRCQPTETGGLSTRSVLAADGKGNVYALDAMPDPQKVRGFRAGDLATLFDLSVPPTTSAVGWTGPNYNFGDHLVIGPDGSLFTTNANTLLAFVPKRRATRGIGLPGWRAGLPGVAASSPAAPGRALRPNDVTVPGG